MNKGFLAVLALGLLLPGCAKQSALAIPAGTGQDGPSPVIEYAAGRELFCLADTEEQAKEIAALYGIELVQFSNGVASFHTEEDPLVVVQRGEENGWPLVEVNRIGHIS